MDFLDSLENSLKNLESREERDGAESQRRADDRARAAAVAPWAERLKSSDFAKKLMDQAAEGGRRLRTKIYMAWLENTLRFEARGLTLELQPQAQGVIAALTHADGTIERRAVDLEDEPHSLLENWLDEVGRVTRS